MKVLIKQAKIFCKNSPFHLQQADLFINNGKIERISPELQGLEGAREILINGLCVSAGWLDPFADFADPGFENRETVESGSAAAAAGGFTGVMLMPSSSSPASKRSDIEYLQNRQTGVSIFPIGCVTSNAEGKSLAEMYDMHAAGAPAFSDGTKPIQHAGVMLKALQYVLPLSAAIIQIPGDQTINPRGLVNEGLPSTRLGLPGIPALAEEMMIARDIELLRFTNSKLHFTAVSTRKGMDIIRKAKAEGLNVTCSVTPYHLHFTDSDLHGYDTNLKVYPPLRTDDDRFALIEAINEGVVDCLASHHLPWHADEKECEFEFARFGMAGIQSVFGAAALHIVDKEKLVHLLINARNIFNLPMPKIREGEIAELTLFNPHETYTFVRNENRSRSANNAFLGTDLGGTVHGTIHQNKILLNK